MSVENSVKGNVERNKAIALRFAKEGWGTQSNWETIWDELVSDDVVYHFNSADAPIVGLAANKEFNGSLFEGFPDIHQTLGAMIAEGENVVYRTILEGTHTGPFLEIPATNRSAKVTDFTQLRIVEGKIVEWWYETNLLELMQQLGLISSLSA